MAADRPATALAAWPDGQAPTAAHVSGLGADVRARSRMGTAARLAPQFRGSSNDAVEARIRSLSGEGGGRARSRAVARAGDGMIHLMYAAWELVKESVME